MLRALRYISNHFILVIDTKLDLAFLIDGSQTVTKESFFSFTSFAKAITASLNVSKDETHVSVTVYGDTPILVSDFNDHSNQSSLENAIDKIVYPASLQSNLGEAMLYIGSILYNTSDGRPGVPKVLVILTASKSHDEITVPSFLLLKHYNVTVFTIGVGAEYSLGQLKEISSDPDSDHVLTFNSGEDLAFQVAYFKEKLGEGKFLTLLAVNTKMLTPVRGGGLRISSDGVIERFFGVWNFRFRGFFFGGGVGKLGKYFFVWLDLRGDLSRDSLGIQNNLTIGGSARVSRPRSSVTLHCICFIKPVI